MDPSSSARAIDAALSLAVQLDLPADHAIVLQDSNKLALRLLPCDTVARVSPPGHDHARFEVALATQLAEAGSPTVTLEPRVEPRGYRLDGFEITFWTYHQPVTAEPSPVAYANALERLHAAMRTIDAPTPRFTDRIAEAEQLVNRRDLTPELADTDREMLVGILRPRRTLRHRSPAEQLLHGEPHPGNVLNLTHGPLFIDLETCCRGPVEFDLAHVPATVSEHYPDLDFALLDEYRRLVLAMVAAWRWDRHDRLPNGRDFGRELLSALRSGPPWPTIDAVYNRINPARNV